MLYEFAISGDAAPPDLERHTQQHDLWLAMQTAHEHYRSACEALENFKLESLLTDRDYNATSAEEERIAFEAYVEARMKFLEFMIDQSACIQGSTVDASYEVAPSQNRLLRGVQRVGMLTAGLVVVLTLCAFAYFGQRRTLHDLDQKNREMNALLSVTEHDVETLAKRVDSLQGNSLSVREHSSITPLLSRTHMKHSHLNT
jgi:hypothetical protein